MSFLSDILARVSEDDDDQQPSYLAQITQQVEAERPARRPIDSIVQQVDREALEPPTKEGRSDVLSGLATGLRIAAPTLGSFAGPAGGAVGGFIGETGGQLIDIANNQRDDFNTATIAAESALGAVPFGKGAKLLAGVAKKPLTKGIGRFAGAAEGAGFGAGSEVVRTATEEGRLADLEDVAFAGATGGVIGGALGGFQAKHPKLSDEIVGGAEGGAPPNTFSGGRKRGYTEIPGVKPDPTGEVRTTQLAEEAHEAAAKGAQTVDVAQILANSPEAKNNERTFRVLFNSIERGDVELGQIAPYLRQMSKNPAAFDKMREQFAIEGKAKVSEAARTLNTQRQLNTYLSRLVDEGTVTLDEATGAFAKIENLKGRGGLQQLEDFRRAVIVSQPATTMRNIWTQIGRYALDAVDDVMADAMAPRGKIAESYRFAGPRFAAQKTKSFVTPFEAKRTRDLVEKVYPQELGKLEGALIGGEARARGKLSNALNILNNTQEKFFRRAILDAHIKDGLARRNIDFNAVKNDVSKLPEDLVHEAVKKALDLTFSGDAKGRLGNAVNAMFREAPFLTVIQPFPRFMVKSGEFLTDFNPGGIFKLLGRDAQQQFRASDPRQVAEAMSKAAIGTGAITAALSLRMSDLAGEKWYEIAPNGKADPLRYDMRAFAPFTGVLFFAELTKQMGDHGTIRMDGNDLLQGAFAMQRLAGTGLLFSNFLTAQGSGEEFNAERIVQLAGDAAGQYVGSFSVPFRFLKDVLASDGPLGFGRDEQKVAREFRGSGTLGERIVGPAMQNIPGLDEQLPERPRLTGARPLEADFPGSRQTLGLTAKFKSGIEKEIDRLNLGFRTIAPKTGINEADRFVAKRLGPLMDRVVAPFIETEFYRNLPDDGLKSRALRDRIAKVKKIALKQATGDMQRERPELVQRLRFEKPSGNTQGEFRRRKLKELFEAGQAQ